MTVLPRFLAAAGALVLGLGGAIVVASPAAAATLTVTNTNDSGGGSLRQAMSVANALAGADTITFSPGVTGTITLATPLQPMTGSLTITGPGQSALTVVGPALPNQNLFATAGGFPTPTLSISDLTIAPDALNASSACGITAVNTDVTVTRVTASGFGCIGVSVTGGSLTATDVTVEDCGTGIAFQASDATDNLTLTNIHAAGGGLSGVNAVLTGGVASVDTVDADDADVFGVYLATTSSGSSTVTGLRADRAGVAGLFLPADAAAQVSISNSSADGSAGQGINLQATGGATITGSGLTATNSASSGIWLSATDSGTVSLLSSLVRGTVANSGIWVDRVDDAALTIDGSEVRDNISDFGGGIYFREITGGGTATVSGTTIDGNESTDDGGGIDVNLLSDDGSSLTVLDSTITGNTSGDFGGGIHLNHIGAGVTSTAKVVIRRTTLDGNDAGGYGGAIAVDDPAAETGGQPTVLVDSSTLSNNTTPYGGGGIHIRRTSSGDPAVVKVLNTTIVDNESQLGGGVDVASANYGVGPGPGPGGPPVIVPGPLLLTTVISHSTITGNSAHTSGGVALNSGDHALEIDNSIVSGSISDTNDPGINDLQVDSPVSYSVRYSLVQAPDTGVVVSPADGNLTGIDPQLAPLAINGGTTRTRLLSTTSPVYNTGDPAFSGAGLFDQRGLARVYQVVDMGAVELQGPPTPPIPSPSPTPSASPSPSPSASPGPSPSPSPSAQPTGTPGAGGGQSTPPADGLAATGGGPQPSFLGLLLLLAGVTMVAYSRRGAARS